MKKAIMTAIISSLIISGCSTVDTHKAAQYSNGNIVKPGEVYFPKWLQNESEINQILSHNHTCSDHVKLRYQEMSPEQITTACNLLKETEIDFHSLFGTENQPVLHDYNTQLRANIYKSREDYINYVTGHFDLPSNNGGMYLQGLPYLPENQAEYVAYMENGHVRNLKHEFVHYLDGRYNHYSDYCANLHDDHNGPEYCPKPAPLFPHLTWWSEGVAEYIARGDNNPKAIKLGKEKT